MQYSLARYLTLGFLTFAIVGALTPLMRKFAIRNGVYDTPNIPRKIHKEPVPYLGGIAIAVGVVVSSYGALLYANFSMHTFELASYVLVPAMAMAVMGLIDDLRGLEPWPRLIIQTLAAIVVSAILISTHTIGTPLNNRFFDSAITIFWIVGLCNSINFFDNLDGGASGTIAIISVFLFYIAFDRHQILVGALSIVTAGATAGFLIWNRSPAKIYMGDAGALFLGIIISVLTIRLNPAIVPRVKSLAIPVFLLAMPILDTTVAVSSRVFRGLSPFEGGRDHLSHRLMRIGIQRKFAAMTLWALAGVYGIVAVAIYKWPHSFGYPLMIIGGLSWIGLLIFFLRIPSTDSTVAKG